MQVDGDYDSENEGEVDSDADTDDEEEASRRPEKGPSRAPGGILTRTSSGALEPLTLKQHCEIVLAREVDLRNAASLLAYADALDAPALVDFCAEFVGSNLDGILVMGRDSDRACLLETSGALVSWNFVFQAAFSVGTLYIRTRYTFLRCIVVPGMYYF